MTIVFDAKRTGPQTHALVVGIGGYPHLKDPANSVAKEFRLELCRQYLSQTGYVRDSGTRERHSEPLTFSSQTLEAHFHIV